MTDGRTDHNRMIALLLIGTSIRNTSYIIRLKRTLLLFNDQKIILTKKLFKNNIFIMVAYTLQYNDQQMLFQRLVQPRICTYNCYLLL